MKPALVLLATLLITGIAKADSQDTLIISYGDVCSADRSCSWTESWAIVAPEAELGLYGKYFSISSIGVPDPAPGFAYSGITTLTELFNVDANCDASGNELVCDEKVLGLYNGGYTIDPTTLPYYQMVTDADPAPLSTSVPEPSLLALLATGILLIGFRNRLPVI